MLPPEMTEAIRRTGRYALMDGNSDGWDDLWELLHSHSRDGRSFEIHIRNDPEGDADLDGISNFLEMLDHRNPWGKEPPVVMLTPAQAKAARINAYNAARANDAKILSRFQSVLERRGVLLRGATYEKTPPALAPDAPDESTSSYSGSEADDVPRLMLCSIANSPQILFSERLSSGNFLLAWEGVDDRLYDVEWSDDLEKWHIGASQLPVVGGVGNWGQFTMVPKRFYRVSESISAPTTIPSDPFGGDGVNTFGVVLAPVILSDGAPQQIMVTANLPSGMNASRVTLVVDGMVHSQCWETAIKNVFIGPINRWNLTEGSHVVHAIVRSDTETTAVQEPSLFAVLKSQDFTFSVNQNLHDAVGFRVTEEQIAPDDPELPTYTEIAVDIPNDPHGSGFVRIEDENGNLIREWTWDLDAYPLEFREIWDGTDQNGSTVPGGSYTLRMNAGGAGFDAGTIQVAAGGRTWSALCLTESMNAARGKTASWHANFKPPWGPYFSSTGSPVPADAWGPWYGLRSAPAIADGLRGRLKGVFGLGSTGKWKVKYWQNGSPANDSVPNPIESFAAGNNPFNDYDMGFFVGHGVASLGGSQNTPGGATIVRPPASYYPLIRSTDTGETHWVCSATMPKYGATGKLKWMFLFTCNSLSTEQGNAIYDVCKANNTLPFGNGLRVLCGYTSKILLDGKMAGLLSEGLWKKVAGEEFRDGTVVNAWGHVWNKSDNRPKGKRARAVYWPECKLDTIYGVKEPHMPPLQPHTSQAELEEKDFP